MYLIFNIERKLGKRSEKSKFSIVGLVTASQALHQLLFPGRRTRRVKHTDVLLEGLGRTVAAQILWLSVQRQ